MYPDLKKEALTQTVQEKNKSLKMGFLLRSGVCQKNTRGDPIQIKIELLLQLSTCSKVEGNGRDK